jgi:hypothetical protein
MKQVDKKTSGDQQAFVVTAVFITQRTITARNETEALGIAEAGLVGEGAKVENLCNYYAHKV